MPSPFPGMDPYLEDEQLWPVFQHQLVMCLYQILLAGPGRPLPGPRRPAPLRHRTGPVHLGGARGAPRRLHRDPPAQRRPARHAGRGGQPGQQDDAARAAGLPDKRREGQDASANLVEIDLVLQGQPTLEYSRDGLPDWDYAVTVTRSTQPERYEIYTATLQKRLPRFRLPLAADDRDTVLDLHTAFTRCYDQGGFARQDRLPARSGHRAGRRGPGLGRGTAQGAETALTGGRSSPWMLHGPPANRVGRRWLVPWPNPAFPIRCCWWSPRSAGTPKCWSGPGNSWSRRLARCDWKGRRSSSITPVITRRKWGRACASSCWPSISSRPTAWHATKLLTNALEQRLAAAGRFPELRPLNLDPGHLSLGKFLLATTKDQAHRIYLREGIYAEVTLRYQEGAFEPWPWTYADYREPGVRAFLKEAREFYRRRLRERGEGVTSPLP